MSTQTLRMGIYKHYKGPLYQVLGLGHDANHDDRVVVVYIPLQLDGAHLGPRIAVRTIEDFETAVHVSEARDNWPPCPGPERCPIIQRTAAGQVILAHYDLTHRKRFTYLGPVLTPTMLEVMV